MVPAGVTNGDDGAVVQRDDAGDAEILASAGARGKGLTLGGAIGGLFRDADGENTCRQDAHQHAHGHDNGQDAFHLLHFGSSFF